MILPKINLTKNTIKQNFIWRKRNYFIKIYIIKGIGYRFYFFKNDLIFNNLKLNLNSINKYNSLNNYQFLKNLNFFVFKFWKFLNIRAGHTLDLLQPLSKHIYIKILKKERKLVLFCQLKQKINNFAQKIFEYRMPSVYTGRGIRQKQIKYIYKIGKKDKQKGKSF